MTTLKVIFHVVVSDIDWLNFETYLSSLHNFGMANRKVIFSVTSHKIYSSNQRVETLNWVICKAISAQINKFIAVCRLFITL